jgi:ribosomal protein L11 methyltransferase
MSDWIEVSITVDGEGAEAAADVLGRYTSGGVAVERSFAGDGAWPEEVSTATGPVLVRAYFPDDSSAAETRRKIEEGLYYLSRIYPIPEPAFTSIKEDDWAEAWKRGFNPIRVGKHLVIKPPWADIETAPEDLIIEIDPGMAFGTGTHPSTQMCLMACEWFCRPGTCMVDIGTGSGILSIAAAKMGCYKVLARDIDELAVRNAQENVERNGVAHKVIVQQGSLDGLVTTARHFDIGMANITSGVILELARNGLQHAIFPGGKFIFAGILQEQVDGVIEALAAADLEVMGRREMGDWVMLITQRKWD